MRVQDRVASATFGKITGFQSCVSPLHSSFKSASPPNKASFCQNSADSTESAQSLKEHVASFRHDFEHSASSVSVYRRCLTSAPRQGSMRLVVVGIVLLKIAHESVVDIVDMI